MNTKWCEIFKTGIHTDSNGNTRNWTIDDLKKIEENFKNKNNDVPICIGHPKTNSPAYGWIDKLKLAGESLFAAYKNVQPEFKEAVQKGLFKTRSISLTPDLVLRHVAFLGGQAPAIKGLEQFCFQNDNLTDEIIISFEDTNMELQNQSTDEDMKKELEEKEKIIKELESELEKEKQKKLTKEFEDFCNDAIKNGNILPSEKNSVLNILQFCGNETINFEDGNSKSVGQIFKSFINGLKRIDFNEIATFKTVVKSLNTVDFQSTESIQKGIIEVQSEYKNKGINLMPYEALAILKK